MKSKSKLWGFLRNLLVCALFGLGVYFLLNAFTDQGYTPAPTPSQTFTDLDPDSENIKELYGRPAIDGPSVYISSIGLEAPLIQTDVKNNGYLELPNPPDATWYQDTQPFTSTTGKSLVASHVDMGYGSAAPFNSLHKIQKGAEILITDFDGVEHRYKAVSMNIYPHSELPSDIFSKEGEHQLVLVTCSGPYLEIGDADYYEYNLVVIADPID